MYSSNGTFTLLGLKTKVTQSAKMHRIGLRAQFQLVLELVQVGAELVQKPSVEQAVKLWKSWVLLVDEVLVEVQVVVVQVAVVVAAGVGNLEPEAVAPKLAVEMQVEEVPLAKVCQSLRRGHSVTLVPSMVLPL